MIPDLLECAKHFLVHVVNYSVIMTSQMFSWQLIFGIILLVGTTLVVTSILLVPKINCCDFM